MKTSECIDCGKRFKVLEKELCYFCYKDKYGSVPLTGCYKIEKVK